MNAPCKVDYLYSLEMDFSHFSPQSGIAPVDVTVNETIADITAQNVHFKDSTEQHEYIVHTNPDSTFDMGNTNDAELGNFFNRPIKRTTDILWTEDTTISTVPGFNPWSEYFSDPRVLEKIKNFNLLRCNLKIKFLVNGNQFHFGRLCASYIPLHLRDQITVQNPAFLTANDMIQASQRPHLYIDPLKSDGGTMTLPYFYHNNFMNIVRQEWNEMGHIQLYLLNPLRAANGPAQPVRISVLMWAEDVVLSIPTASDPGGSAPASFDPDEFAPSSGKSKKGDKDEYGTGLISKPASVLSGIAGKLKDVPVIGPYARATEIAAGATAGVASLFGYSRPTQPKAPSYITPRYIGNLANTNIEDTATKLALDAKQELSVDSRTMGLTGEDEMTVLSISQRESYLNTFLWNYGTASETHLQSYEVSPVLWGGTSLSITGVHVPACAFATLPFEFWTGTMHFRFQIVASAVHKGRLKFVFDPQTNAATTAYNVAYTRIVDISEERDFTMSIGWANERPFLRHRGLRLVSNNSSPHGPNLITSPGNHRCNGVLSVYVLNESVGMTTDEDATNTIQINTFISTGPDFRVAGPTSSVIQDIHYFPPSGAVVPASGRTLKNEFQDYQPQSGGDHPDADHTTEENAPVQTQVVDTIAEPVSDLILHSISGEVIASFRTCLKRYNLHAFWPGRMFTAPNYFYRFINSNFPIYYGFSPRGIGRAIINFGPHAGSVRRHNMCRTTLLNYITPAYVAWRGGIRWKYVKLNWEHHDLTTVDRLCTSDLQTQNYAVRRYDSTRDHTDGANGYTRARQELLNTPHGWSGCEATISNQNPSIEVELPFYSNKRFYAAKTLRIEESGTMFEQTEQAQYHRYITRFSQPATVPAGVTAFVSTGEDFNLAFFTGCPRLWSLGLPGTADAEFDTLEA